jgi:hypothetical protein
VGVKPDKLAITLQVRINPAASRVARKSRTHPSRPRLFHACERLFRRGVSPSLP